VRAEFKQLDDTFPIELLFESRLDGTIGLGADCELILRYSYFGATCRTKIGIAQNQSYQTSARRVGTAFFALTDDGNA
jgi:hypothetical protein